MLTSLPGLEVVARHMAEAFDRHAGEWTENPVAAAIRQIAAPPARREGMIRRQVYLSRNAIIPVGSALSQLRP